MTELTTADEIATVEDGDYVPIRKAAAAGVLKLTMAKLLSYVFPSFTGNGERLLAVMADESGVEWIDAPSGGGTLDDAPSDGSTYGRKDGEWEPVVNDWVRTTLTAIDDQTDFDATYAVGYVQVFLNGVMLNPSDYTASDGATVVLATAASAGDVVDVIAATSPGGFAADSPAVSLVKELNAPVGKAHTAKGEYVAVTGGSEQTLMDVAGKGYVENIFLAIWSPNQAAREQTVLKIYVDGEVTPSVECTVARFFGADYPSSAVAFQTKYIGMSYSGEFIDFRCSIPMPFSTHMKITITPPSGQNITNAWWTIGYHLNDTINWGRCKRFRAVEATNAAVAANSRHTLIDVDASGVILGLYSRTDGDSFAYLEGNFRIFVDGETSAAWECSGYEDYFGMGFYFQGYNSNTGPRTEYAGLTFKNAGTYAVGAYRFHTNDPVQFDSHIKIDVQLADTSQAAYSGTTNIATCVWYYTTE